MSAAAILAAAQMAAAYAKAKDDAQRQRNQAMANAMEKQHAPFTGVNPTPVSVESNPFGTMAAGVASAAQTYGDDEDQQQKQAFNKKYLEYMDAQTKALGQQAGPQAAAQAQPAPAAVATEEDEAAKREAELRFFEERRQQQQAQMGQGVPWTNMKPVRRGVTGQW